MSIWDNTAGPATNQPGQGKNPPGQSNDPKYMGADDDQSWAADVYDWGKGAGSSIKNWLSGGPGYDTKGYQYNEEAASYARGWDAESRRNQATMAQIYQDRIDGRSPSVAQQQMQVQNADNKAQQLAMARSGGGGALGQAGAMRTAQMTASQQDLGLARNAGLVRAQEQAQAEAGLADLYNTQRQQDQGRLGAENEYQLGKANVHAGLEGTKAKAHEDAAERNAGGGIIGGFSTALKSDKTAKTDIRPTSDGDLEDFLEAAKAYWWRYKQGDSADDGGRLHMGPMAQDLAKTKVGRSVVKRMPDGDLGVDVDGSYGAFLAGLGELHDRVQALEGRKGGK
jgi:hypothetical protein